MDTRLSRSCTGCGETRHVHQAGQHDERRQPELINGSRRLRIANGSGTTTGEVNRLVKQFQEMQKLMKRMGGLGSKKGKRRMPALPPGFPGMN